MVIGKYDSLITLTVKFDLYALGDDLTGVYAFRYAIHNAGVGFTLKKVGETGVEVKTQPQNTILDNIRFISSFFRIGARN